MRFRRRPWTNLPAGALLIVLAGGAARAERLPPPSGFRRLQASPGSFADFLRRLPLKPSDAPVRLFDGRLKNRQDVHAAVVDMEIGGSDLQQCADAVIRLRAEYLWSIGEWHRIRFQFVSGFAAEYSRWRQGFRPVVAGSRVFESRIAAPDESRAGFRRYLDEVFTYANSWSLARELRPVPDVRRMQIGGDVFIQGGFPGHAVIVADMADDNAGHRVFMLLQSFMPAQDIHVLKNPADGSAWYPLDFGDRLGTPEWTFRQSDLFRFE